MEAAEIIRSAPVNKSSAAGYIISPDAYIISL